MRKQFLSHLSDPLTGGVFQLVVFDEKEGHVMAGLLWAGEQWYPIIAGIPRLLVGKIRTNLLQNHHSFFTKNQAQFPEAVRKEWRQALAAIPDFNNFLRHRKKTAESFSYEWKYIYKENDFERENFYHFLSPFLEERDFRDKVTIDIGCGSGRFTKWAALSGARMAFGSDLGETVEVAFNMTRNLPNVCIVQADIYHMPFREIFDVAYSIGVLHHLPKPQEGFSCLPKVLKEEGKILVWVYNRRHNLRALYFYEPLRSLLKKLPKPLLFKLCYLPGGVVHALNFLTLFFRKIGWKRAAKRMPFSYYANFPFNMKLNDAFDVLATPKSNYYYREEIERWFRDARLRDIRAYEHPEAGITCIGTYGR